MKKKKNKSKETNVAQSNLDKILLQVEDYCLFTLISQKSCYQMADYSIIENIKSLLLIDSCFFVNFLSNEDLLHNLHEDDRQINVHCNAKGYILNKMTSHGNFPKLI